MNRKTFAALLWLGLAAFVSSDPVVLNAEKLQKLRTAGDGRAYLILCHAAPVNSKESEAALEVWKSLEHPLSGISDVTTLHCDDFPTECHMLQAAHFPQVILLVGGETLLYSGPITSKALYLFATNNVYSPVAQLNSKNLEWWLSFETEGRVPVFLLHDSYVLPVAYSALARSLYKTHAFAEIRTVSDSVRSRFGVEKLPAIAKGSTQADKYVLYDGEFKRGQLRAFLLGEEEVESEHNGWPAGVVPPDTFGIPHLTLESAPSLCEATCTILFLPDGVASAAIKERRVRMEAARDLSRALAKQPKRGSSPPKLVWASRYQRALYDAFQGCLPDGDVALAVWKVKRNRAAVTAAPLTVGSGVKFVEAVMTGDASFVELPDTPQQLLGGSAPPAEEEDEEEGVQGPGEVLVGAEWYAGKRVPAGFESWLAPTNVLAESQDQQTVPPWARGASEEFGGDAGQGGAQGGGDGKKDGVNGGGGEEEDDDQGLLI